MSRASDYERQTEELLLPILKEQDFMLWSVEFEKEAGQEYLRVYIDKEGGITIDDCELVSRALEEKLDALDFIAEPYILEVSSPGLDRPLRRDRDLELSIGRPVFVRLYAPREGEKEFEGDLLSYDDKTVTLQSEEGETTFLRTEIALIRLNSF